MLSADRKKQLNKLLKILNIRTDNLEPFNTALTHPSFNFESNNYNKPDYERLEFLGDSVARLVVSNYLFDKYQDFEEGKLTKIRNYLVSDNFFYKTALKFKLNDYLNIGINEEKDGGRNKESILACSMEAVFGAIYKTIGYEAAKNFIYSIYDNTKIDTNDILYLYNSKEILQEYTQGLHKNLPEYKIISETGQAHNKMYSAAVVYEGRQLGAGQAKTKKEAEKMAALNALKVLNLIEDNNEE